MYENYVYFDIFCYAFDHRKEVTFYRIRLKLQNSHTLFKPSEKSQKNNIDKIEDAGRLFALSSRLASQTRKNCYLQILN